MGVCEIVNRVAEGIVYIWIIAVIIQIKAIERAVLCPCLVINRPVKARSPVNIGDI